MTDKRRGLNYLQLLKAISAPPIDFGLLNPLPIRCLDIQGKLAPSAVKVIRAKKGALF